MRMLPAPTRREIGVCITGLINVFNDAEHIVPLEKIPETYTSTLKMV